MTGGRQGVPGFDPHKLRAARQRDGVTLGALAAAAGVHIKELGEWESGRRVPQVDTVADLARALGLRPRDLLDEAEDREWTLRDLRLNAGLTQQQAAAAAGLERTTYSSIERGETVELARGYDSKIASAVDSTPDRVRDAHQVAVRTRRSTPTGRSSTRDKPDPLD